MRFIRDYSRIRIVEFNFWIRIPTPPHAPAIPLPVSTRISPCPNSTLREYPEAEELVTGHYRTYLLPSAGPVRMEVTRKPARWKRSKVA